MQGSGETKQADSLPFAGTERFVLEDVVGEGGMGVVYRAHDRQRQATVALKTLSRVSAKSIYQFKREFRALADLSHPNVVNLYELISHGEHWFFTMELVDGEPLTTALWTEKPAEVPNQSGVRAVLYKASADTIDLQSSEALADTTTAGRLHDTDDPDSDGGSPAPSPGGAIRATPCRDVPRLRRLLRSLVSGVSVVHGAGKLHCDLKPSNVLVTRGDRVVVLDFGIVTDLSVDSQMEPGRKAPAGTPAYMAPEQAVAEALSPAADWYAVGVMLYEVLTGQLPHDGNVVGLLAAKQHDLPPRPSELVSGVPDDLDALCMDLLRPKPSERPTSAQILRRLSSAESTPRPGVEVGTSVERPIGFVGRAPELGQLHDAFDEVARGCPVTVVVRGPSGMGKSRLVDHFVEEAELSTRTLVLSGRCFEREEVPYKVFDSLIDSLSRFLVKLSLRKAQALLPPGVHELAVLFPVLRAVAAVEATAPKLVPQQDPHERRLRAFAALRGLLHALCRRRQVILRLDDVHWGDVDSAAMLDAVLAPPDAPPVLTLLSHRREVEVQSGFLAESRHLASSDVRFIDIEELSEPDSVDFATQLLEGLREDDAPPSSPQRLAELARTIAREGGGNPLFITELVRYAGERQSLLPVANDEPSSSLDEVLAGRIAGLPDDARRLLAAIGLVGVPVDQTLALQAAEIDPGDWAALSVLRTKRFVNSQATQGGYRLTASHDRIRQSIVSHLTTDERRHRHGQLARVLAATGHADPETLAHHYREAGETSLAMSHAVEAANLASKGLAFLRAAELYELAISLSPTDPPLSLRRKLGEALALAGRGGAAGRAFRDAANATSGLEATRLRRLAAEQFLKGGHEADGLAVLEQVLSEVGLPYPRSPAAALASLLYQRGRTNLLYSKLFRISGSSEAVTELTRRSAATDAELERADAAFTASIGLSLTDTVRGTSFGGRFLALALASGEPVRICRALAFEASAVATPGRRGRQRAEALTRAAAALATQTGDPHTMALAKLSGSYIPFFMGEWREARTRFEEAERLLRDECLGVAWEMGNCQQCWLNTVILLGDLVEATRRVPGIMTEARERGDRYALMQMTYATTVCHIVADDVPAARRAASEHVPAWTPDRYTTSHWAALTSAVSVDRYVGDGLTAWERFEREWPALRRSLLMRVQIIRVFAGFERAMSAVAAAENGFEPERLLEIADRAASSMLEEGPAYAMGMGHHVRASVRAARGDRLGALEDLGRAIAYLREGELGYIGACARFRRGQLLGGECGTSLCEEAVSFLQAQGIRNVMQCARMSAPGYARATES